MADLTLCIFPNLPEFLAIDSRDGSAGRERIQLLNVRDISREEFLSGLESAFGKMIRDRTDGFMGLLNLPKKIEELVRAYLLKSVVDLIHADGSGQPLEDPGSIGVVLFTGDLLEHLNTRRLRHVTGELFSERLSEADLARLVEMLEELIERQRSAEDEISRSNIGNLISGKGGPYVTLWESGKG